MGCGISKSEENGEFYEDESKSVQTSPLPDYDIFVYQDEIDHPHEESAHATPTGTEDTVDSGYDNNLNQPVEETVNVEPLAINNSKYDRIEEEATEANPDNTGHVSVITPPVVEVISKQDSDDGYKSDTLKPQKRVNLEPRNYEPRQYHRRRRQRSRQRRVSTDASTMVNISRSHRSDERERNDSKNRRPYPPPPVEAKSPSSTTSISTLSSSSTSSTSTSTRRRVAGGKNRKGQPPPPWRHSYVAAKPKWADDYRNNNNDQ